MNVIETLKDINTMLAERQKELDRREQWDKEISMQIKLILKSRENGNRCGNQLRCYE